MYTISLINSGWDHIDNHYENILAVIEKEGDNINAIITNILTLIKTYKIDNSENIATYENAFNKLIAKIKQPTKDLLLSEYVTNKEGFKVENSFYDFSNEIKINYKNETYYGIICISDHEIDLNKWAQNNSKYDFGISFVIKEPMCEWKENDIVDVPNRNILIGEYTYKTSRNNFKFLNMLTAEIFNIKKTKKLLANQIIMGFASNIVSNSPLIKEHMVKSTFKKDK